MNAILLVILLGSSGLAAALERPTGPVLPSDSKSETVANDIRSELETQLKADEISVTKWNVINYRTDISGCCSQNFYIKIQINDEPDGYVLASAHIWRSGKAFFGDYQTRKTLTDPIR
ncbi:hypothetical protein BV898_04517 [Hypsibius exemplaris]|uniref:Cystatin domain-containing protein n=1 Tax=Hypsibius exemplaris TaxID=2072580 RepID=A0A1W0X283_HYPEX|nr:hypothetical protein BV898_04517 [Hypsibius exemplaris]